MRATDLPHRATPTRRGPAASLGSAELAAARYARRQLGGIDHERRVLAIATRLFDLTRPLLRLSAAHGRLLRLAALLHDVGRSIDDGSHPRQGAKLIAGAGALPLTPTERRQLMFLTRYHRGAVPPPGREEYLTPGDDRTSLHAVLALLRVADGLDNRRLPPLQLRFTLTGHHLAIDAAAASDLVAAKRVFTRRKKFRMLEELLGRRVSIDVHRAAAVHV